MTSPTVSEFAALSTKCDTTRHRAIATLVAEAADSAWITFSGEHNLTA